MGEQVRDPEIPQKSENVLLAALTLSCCIQVTFVCCRVVTLILLYYHLVRIRIYTGKFYLYIKKKKSKTIQWSLSNQLKLESNSSFRRITQSLNYINFYICLTAKAYNKCSHDFFWNENFFILILHMSWYQKSNCEEWDPFDICVKV